MNTPYVKIHLSDSLFERRFGMKIKFKIKFTIKNTYVLILSNFK